MPNFPSRFRRLDGILADLPVEDPMLLTELDGYLSAIVVCPDEASPALWLPPIWDGSYGEFPPFGDPVDVRLFGEMVQARHDEIERDLGRGRPQPIFDVEGRNGEVVREDWVGCFEMAMSLQQDAWTTAADNAALSDAISRMRTLADVAFDRSSLTAADINMICDEAPRRISTLLQEMYVGRTRSPLGATSALKAAKVGRNDSCPCGSGSKYKRCCGASL